MPCYAITQAVLIIYFMSYQVLARKWRPKQFAEVVGQEHVLSSLMHALNAQRVHHAYLFTGTRGVGKTTIARILAKSLSCEQGVSDTPCGQCDHCQSIDAGRFVDLIEIDAASRTKVEDTRELLDNVQYAPTQGRYKIYLIDEVHMLSTHSFNALLKTLEEPPEHVKFLLATTDPQKLPITVLSRCLQYHLRHLSCQEIVKHLVHVLDEEHIVFESAALEVLARAAQGSVRDALSLLDQAIAAGEGKVTAVSVHQMLGTLDCEHTQALLEAIVAQDQAAMVRLIEQLREFGVDGAQVLCALSTMLYHIALQQALPDALPQDVDVDLLKDFAARLSPLQVQVLYQVAVQCHHDINKAPDTGAGLEMALLRLMYFRPVELPTQQTTVAVPQSQVTPGSTVPKPKPVSPSQPKAVKPIDTVQPTTDTSHNGVADLAWQAIVEQLDLKGIANQLAHHCTLVSQQDDKVVLCVDHKHAPMAQERVRQSIEAALQNYLARPVHLVIEAGEQLQSTPAKEKAVAQAQQHDELVTAIETDPNVQFMQAQLGAIIAPDSIKPNDSN